jgi:hypothetical protein
LSLRSALSTPWRIIGLGPCPRARFIHGGMANWKSNTNVHCDPFCESADHISAHYVSSDLDNWNKMHVKSAIAPGPETHVWER